jgi:hypothetical protein
MGLECGGGELEVAEELGMDVDASTSIPMGFNCVADAENFFFLLIIRQGGYFIILALQLL